VNDQTTCPEQSCALEVPGVGEASGWMVVGAHLWCPYHAPTEQRRLHNHDQAVEFYQGNIRTREQAIAEHARRKQHIRALAKVHRIRRQDPELKRALAREDARKAQAEHDLPILENNLAAENERHEQENAVRAELAMRPPGAE
jgi:hypothetical protein